jgi:hypothetical protein
MITPGIGYTYTNSPYGFALVIDQAIPAPLPPLTVYEDVNQSGQGVLKVTPGTVNNVVPSPLEVSFPSGSGNEHMVVIKCTGEKNQRFPIQATVEVVTATEATQDTDGYGYLAIALLTKTTTPSTVQGAPPVIGWTVTPLVSGSVWAERRKLTAPNTAFYYFSRV